MIRLLLILLISTQTIAQTSVEKAKILWEAKNNTEAKKILSTIAEGNKDYAVAQYYLGRIARDESNLDDAADFFEEAVDADPKVADYYLWLGETYAMIAQNANTIKQGILATEMKSAWEKVVELDPSNVEARQALIQFYAQAPSFMGGGIDKAKEMAKEIVKLKPANGHLQLGNIYLRENNPQAAEMEYTEAIKADPTYFTGLVNFYINQKLYDKAFAYLDDYLKKNPKDYSSIYMIGKVSAISGLKLDKGEECLKKYMAYKPKPNEPSYAGANMRLGQIYEKRSNKVESKKYFETALKLDATLKEAKEGLTRVSN